MALTRRFGTDNPVELRRDLYRLLDELGRKHAQIDATLRQTEATLRQLDAAVQAAQAAAEQLEDIDDTLVRSNGELGRAAITGDVSIPAGSNVATASIDPASGITWPTTSAAALWGKDLGPSSPWGSKAGAEVRRIAGLGTYRCVLRKSAPQSLGAASGFENITWNVEEVDDGLHAGSNAHITIPEAGVYLVTWSVRTSVAGSWRPVLASGGDTNLGTWDVAADEQWSFTWARALSANDQVRIQFNADADGSTSYNNGMLFAVLSLF